MESPEKASLCNQASRWRGDPLTGGLRWSELLLREFLSEFVNNFSHSGWSFPVVTRVDICSDQTRINQHKGSSETRDPSVGDD